MKNTGLSSTFRNMHKRSTKITMSETQQKNFLASKEKLKSLRAQAAKAQFERQKREAQK